MRALLPVAIVLALLSFAAATHPCTPTTSHPEVDVAGRYYHDVDLVCLGTEMLCSFWTYEESNGISGLQREDEIVDDTCHGTIDGDTIIL